MPRFVSWSSFVLESQQGLGLFPYEQLALVLPTHAPFLRNVIPFHELLDTDIWVGAYNLFSYS
ncbi:MAG: hypothetical protein RMX96_24610 [Nostoc sp. ChiSLP02]|nr:hypothetical protein [Nostoc sp. DedSLP05]MDZ8103228.1 hypothetical protein [Nostoc sp. DedSLP01]MDZ8188021.1 hypothetical protein [Nostoc sp. ChiSLP02]